MLYPDTFLKMIDNDWSVSYFRELKQQRLLAIAESSGVTNTDEINNLQVFIFVILIFLVIFLIPLPFLALRDARPIIERRTKKIINNTYYNGIIAGKTVAYLKASIAFGLTFKTIDWS